MEKETLEEAAERAIKSGLFKDKTLFIAGAKWQAERMYSEEDIEKAHFAGKIGRESFSIWFEQFKKK
jgi:hypothetical protein